MTCEQAQEVMFANREFSVTELYAAREHARDCPECHLASHAEILRLQAVMNPEQVMMAEVLAARLGRELDVFSASDPEAV